MRWFASAFCFATFSIAAFGQAGTGTITGTVTDPAGAAIANAPVEVRNTDTNVPYPTVDHGHGRLHGSAAAARTL